jgi:hypothetical protein
MPADPKETKSLLDKEGDKKGDKKGDKAKLGKDGKPLPELGPDGKPIPPKPLTEVEQIQLQIENTASEVRLFCIKYILYIPDLVD